MPAEIVVAILGVETFYGRNAGSYRVLDALTTLAFDYPRRAAFFRGELKQFLLLARELRMSPLAAKGSFAGAMGVPQFMPGSYRSYAVDFDGNGRADLWTSPADVVGSVANYLARHDWQPGKPVLLPAAIADDNARRGVAQARRRPLRAPRARCVGGRWRDPGDSAARSAERSRRPAAARRIDRRRRGRELLDRVQQLLRAHALQPQPALRRGGVRARAGDQGGARRSPALRPRESTSVAVRDVQCRHVRRDSSAPASAGRRSDHSTTMAIKAAATKKAFRKSVSASAEPARSA